MGKRLQKILKTTLKKEISKIIGKELDVVLSDKSTLHGYAQSFEKDVLKVSDKRGDLHNIPIERIEEIIIDLQAAY